MHFRLLLVKNTCNQPIRLAGALLCTPCTRATHETKHMVTTAPYFSSAQLRYGVRRCSTAAAGSIVPNVGAAWSRPLAHLRFTVSCNHLLLRVGLLLDTPQHFPPATARLRCSQTPDFSPWKPSCKLSDGVPRRNACPTPSWAVLCPSRETLSGPQRCKTVGPQLYQSRNDSPQQFPAGPEGSRAGAHARRIQWPPASGPASSRRQPSGGCPGRRSALCSLSCGGVLSIGRLPRLRIAQYITADCCHSQLIHIDLDLCCLRRLAWALTQVACLTLLQPWDDLLPRLRLLEVLVSRAAKDHL